MNAVKKRIRSGSNPNNLSSSPSNQQSLSSTNDPSLEGLSPELIPIVTLLSSQSHRRYHEGIFMLYYDLNGDGKPAEREWREVYGILTGNQLAYWDAANLAQFKNNPEQLLETSAKPTYINFTDSIYNAMKILPSAKQNLDNVIIVSTTLKNRYILQFKSYKDLTLWYSSLRLSNYEYNSLQEAYTGALLSARGSRLSDIRTILAEKRFDHEDWVSIRYGSGMAWKRCFAVVEPSNFKKKSFTPGRILFYENDQKKKKQLMAVVSTATSVTAIYPQSHLLIDHSTMLKMDGFINFNSPSISTKISKKNVDDFKQTSIFLMPEQHSSVPGFDTLIRFLIPLLDSFGLYGRPKRLKANRSDIDSLLFGLPTLPRVHYLELEDVLNLTQQRGDFLSWDLSTWTNNIKALMKSKIDRGYDGCGSQRGYAGAITSLNSPQLSSGSPRFPSSSSQQTRSASSSLSKQSSHQLPPPPPQQSSLRDSGKGFDKNIHDLSIGTNNTNFKPNVPIIIQNGGAGGIQQATSTTPMNNSNYQSLTPTMNNDSKLHHKSVQLDDIYQKYSDLKTPSDNYHTDQLSPGVQQLNIGKAGAYPKDDDGLFSGDESNLEEEDDEDDEKIDISQIGKPKISNNGLQVPYIQENNSGSYSSVMSPMAQFNDLKNQYKAVDRKIPNYNLNDDEEGDSPPPVPKHNYESSSSPNFGGKLNVVNQGTRGPTNQTQTSIHSESGRVSSGSSSSGSFTKHEEVLAPYPALPSKTQSQPQPINKPINKPRFISSPNSSQNQINRFHSPERKPPPTSNLSYPVSPERLAKVQQSQENLTDVLTKPLQPSPPKQQNQKPVPFNPYQLQPQSSQQLPMKHPQQQYPLKQPQYYPQGQFQPQQQHPSQPKMQQQVPSQQYKSMIPPQQQTQPFSQRPIQGQVPNGQPQNNNKPLPRSYGNPQLQHQLQNEPLQQSKPQAGQFRGYDSNQQYQYSYQPQPQVQGQGTGQTPYQSQPQGQLQTRSKHPYAQYSDQYANGSSRKY